MVTPLTLTAGIMSIVLLATTLGITRWIHHQTGRTGRRPGPSATEHAPADESLLPRWFTLTSLIAILITIGLGAPALIPNTTPIQTLAKPLLIVGAGVLWGGFIIVGSYDTLRSRGQSPARATAVTTVLTGTLGLAAIVALLIFG